MVKFKLIAFITITLMLLSSGAAVTEQEAQSSIGNASQTIDDLRSNEVPVQRLEDILSEANQTYRARRDLQSPSFDRVIELTDQIQELSQTALRARDEIEVLREEIEIAEEEGINVSAARNDLESAEEDLQSGRYEEALDDVDRGYSSLSEARALSVRLETFYQEETENIASYIQENKQKLSVYVIAGFASLLIFVRELRMLNLRRIKKKLERREESVEKLIIELEKKYYQEQDMPKKAFEVRKEKFKNIRNEVKTKIPEIERELEKRFSIQELVFRRLF